MNFVADEGVDVQMVIMLRGLGHNVFYIAEEFSGIDDESILKRSNLENRILLPQDKDFGEQVYRRKMVHSGVVLIRLMGLKAALKTDILKNVIVTYSKELYGNFIVIEPGAVRIRGFDYL